MAAHRDLGYLFAGIITIYALSGIFMNHRDSLNPSFSVEVTERPLPSAFPADKAAVGRDDIDILLNQWDAADLYTKHYPSRGDIRVLLKGGSSVTIDMDARTATYEKIQRRFIISDMVKLHYNPGRWWTWFSDIFAASLILITITGLIILKGKNGFWYRGAVLLVIGIIAPILILI